MKFILLLLTICLLAFNTHANLPPCDGKNPYICFFESFNKCLGQKTEHMHESIKDTFRMNKSEEHFEFEQVSLNIEKDFDCLLKGLDNKLDISCQNKKDVCEFFHDKFHIENKGKKNSFLQTNIRTPTTQKPKHPPKFGAFDAHYVCWPKIGDNFKNLFGTLLWRSTESFLKSSQHAKGATPIGKFNIYKL